MNNETKLSGGQKHLLKLIANGADAEGWATVGKMVFPHVKDMLPNELAHLELVGNEGAGRARLTPAGQNVLNAMVWL